MGDSAYGGIYCEAGSEFTRLIDTSVPLFPGVCVSSGFRAAAQHLETWQIVAYHHAYVEQAVSAKTNFKDVFQHAFAQGYMEMADNFWISLKPRMGKGFRSFWIRLVLRMSPHRNQWKICAWVCLVFQEPRPNRGILGTLYRTESFEPYVRQASRGVS